MVKGHPSPLDRLIAHRVEVTPDQMRDALVARWSHRKDNGGNFYSTDPVDVALENCALEPSVFLRRLTIYENNPIDRPGTLFKTLSQFGELTQAIEYLYLLLPDKEDFRPINDLMVPTVIITPDSNYLKHGEAVYNGLMDLKKQVGKMRDYAHKTIKSLAQFYYRFSPQKKKDAPDLVFRSFLLRLGLNNVGEKTLTDREFNLLHDQGNHPFPFGDVKEWNKHIFRTTTYTVTKRAWDAGKDAYSASLKWPCHKQEISLERSSSRGISFSWRGLDNVRNSDGQIERFKIVLEEFRKQADRYYPEALRLLPNITAWSYNPNGQKTPWANYYTHLKQIGFYIHKVPFTDGQNENLPEAVQTLAHELGHHVFRVQFSQEIQNRLEEVLHPKAGAPISTWIEGLDIYSKYGTTYATNEHARWWLYKNNPVAWLQLQIAGALIDPDYHKKSNSAGAFLWKPEKEQPFHMTIGALKKLPDNLEVLKWPVTAYAAVNAEETFCEAFGLLIAYGPMAVLEPIREWIYRFIPKLRRNPAARMISNTEVITNTPELR